MKKNYTKFLLINSFILITFFSAFKSQAQFVTQWATTADNQSITIPTTGGGYNYSVDWGDSSPNSSGLTGDATHIYLTAGSYTVSITGNFPRIYFNNSGDLTKLREITQWGSNPWTNMSSAFNGCSLLQITATDAPVLSGVTSTFYMFAGCTNLNPEGAAEVAMNNWNTSTITDMRAMFNLATSFNANIGNWNTGAVKNMFGLFYDATSFNRDIGNWNTGEVTNISSMFYGATSFNQNIGNWNTVKVTNMTNLFYNATSFNQNIGNWNTASVTTMFGMFSKAINFDQDLDNWNTSIVENMSFMFSNASAFNGNVSSWNTAAVTTMFAMFQKAYLFNSDISNWNTSSVKDMGYMFFGATSFNQNIGNWNTAQVELMQLMFNNATSFNQNLQNWNISLVGNMQNMLNNTVLSIGNYDQTLIGWAAQSPLKTNVSLGALSLKYCAGEAARNQLINTYNWNITGDIKDCSTNFITKWTTSSANESITIPTTGGGYNYSVNWGDGTTQSINQTGNATHSYSNAGNYTVSISGSFPRIYFNDAGDKDKITDISQWGTNSWTNMAFAFRGCSNLNMTATDAPSLSNVTSTSYMFGDCISLNPTGTAAASLNTWNTNTIINMSGMFNLASNFNQNIGNWNITNVTTMEAMLSNSGMSRFFYDKTLKGWDAQTVQNGVPLGALNVRYCNSVNQRNDLINNHGWIITGDINDCSVLPIDLISFTAQKSGANAVAINWTTGVESNVATMSVQHSNDANNWKSIYECAPKGSNSKYETLDNNPVAGINYYRLLTIDLDGSQRYSDVRSVNFTSSLLANVYPNPTYGSITIRNIKSGDVIVLTDVTGRQILKKQASAETQILDINSLAQGMYFISVMQDGKVVLKDKITKL